MHITPSGNPISEERLMSVIAVLTNLLSQLIKLNSRKPSETAGKNKYDEEHADVRAYLHISFHHIIRPQYLAEFIDGIMEMIDRQLVFYQRNADNITYSFCLNSDKAGIMDHFEFRLKKYVNPEATDMAYRAHIWEVFGSGTFLSYERRMIKHKRHLGK